MPYVEKTFHLYSVKVLFWPQEGPGAKIPFWGVQHAGHSEGEARLCSWYMNAVRQAVESLTVFRKVIYVCI